MIKRTTFSLVGDEGEIFIKNIDTSFTKQAEFDNLDKGIMEFINKIEPKEGKSYLLINAMGASDYFSSNMNADWFSEKVLEDHHKSFEVYGHAFRHHVNKDRKIAQGKVLFSFYNRKMHRVELVVEVDNNKVEDILEKLNKKELPATSMACKVSYDVCSICGNKAKSRKEYCTHLRFYKNKIHTPASPIPGAKSYGQKVYAINPDPKFFDISFVTVPADHISSVLVKIAEAFMGKKSDMIKKIKTPIIGAKEINPGMVIDSHGNLTRDEMKKLIEKYSMADVMGHMVKMSMFPSRKDFQYMSMLEDGLQKEAEVLYDSNISFDCSESKINSSVEAQLDRMRFNTGLAEKLAEYGERLGMGEPLVLARIFSTDFEKVATTTEEKQTINAVPYFAGLGGAYWAYNHWLDKKRKSKTLASLGFETKVPPAAKNKGATFLMRQHPLLVGAGLVGAGVLTNLAQKAYLKGERKYNNEKRASVVDADYLKRLAKKPGLGQFLTATAIATPAVFLYGAHNRRKIDEGKPTSHLGRFVAAHPYLSTTGVIAATYTPQRIIRGWQKGKFGREKVASLPDYLSYLYISDKEEFDKLYNDAINY